MIPFVNERIFQFSAIFEFVVSRTVCGIPSGEKSFIQIGSCHSSNTESEPFQRIVADSSIDGANVDLARIPGLDIALNHSL